MVACARLWLFMKAACMLCRLYHYQLHWSAYLHSCDLSTCTSFLTQVPRHAVACILTGPLLPWSVTDSYWYIPLERIQLLSLRLRLAKSALALVVAAQEGIRIIIVSKMQTWTSKIIQVCQPCCPQGLVNLCISTSPSAHVWRQPPWQGCSQARACVC